MNNDQSHLLRAPDDVLIVILNLLDSINALISLSSTCRKIRSLFEHFPRQICASVTNNRLGLYASTDPTNVSKSCFPFQSPPNSTDPDELRKFVVQDSLRIERLLIFIERTTIWLTDTPSVRFKADDPSTAAQAADFYAIRTFRLVDSSHHKFAFCALIHYYHASLSESKDRTDYKTPLPPTIIQSGEERCYNLVKLQMREAFWQLDAVRRHRKEDGRILPLDSTTGGHPPEEMMGYTHQIWPLFEYYYMKAMLKAEIIETKEELEWRRTMPLRREKCPHTAPRIRENDDRDLFTWNALPVPRNQIGQGTGST